MTKALDNLEWTSLGVGDYGLYQERAGWRFSIDAVMLSHFAKAKANEKILDIGCGNGAIGHLMALDEATASFVGVDIEPSVIALAKMSKERNALSDERLSFFVHDIISLNKAWHSHFDQITANPPFFKASHGKLSPKDKIARARHELTMTLDDLFRASYFYLKYRGILSIVHRSERLDEIFSIARKHRLKPKSLRSVFATQKSTESKLSLISFVKDGNDSLKVLAPLYEFDEFGNYNEEINTWYGRK